MQYFGQTGAKILFIVNLKFTMNWVFYLVTLAGIFKLTHLLLKLPQKTCVELGAPLVVERWDS